MPYLQEPSAIREAIACCAQADVLWLDTEVAEHQTEHPKLSLIQVLTDAQDRTGERVLIFDVLEQPQLVREFIDQIMLNAAIEKVFHNASYDVRFLGKRKGHNITCTLEMARKLPYYLVSVPNCQLKTLAEHLCHFSPIDVTEQTGAWGQRPLTAQQLHYAKMDPVYVAQVHQRLRQLASFSNPDPETEDIAALTLRYRQIEERWKQLNTEIEHLKKRLKRAMESQQVLEVEGFKLSRSRRTKKKVSVMKLVEAMEAARLDTDFSLELTKDMQKELSDIMAQLPVEEEHTTYTRLSVQDISDEDVPF
ncbi:MAG: ribonuclease D [Cyanophyceae cyanobacterium]